MMEDSADRVSPDRISLLAGDPDPDPLCSREPTNSEPTNSREPGERSQEQLTLPVDLGLAEDWTLASLEAVHIAAVLARTGHNLTRASARLGIDRRTLHRKLVKYELYAEYKKHRRTNGI
jgi:DNA-binding NtrC family response regulator